MEEPKLRRPKSSEDFKRLLFSLAKLDFYNYFRESNDNDSIRIPDSINSFVNSQCYIDCANDNRCITIIIPKKKVEKPYKKLKTSLKITKFNPKTIIFDLHHVNDYFEHRDNKLQSLDDIYDFANTNNYFSIDQIKRDFVILMLKKLRDSKSASETIYINKY